MAASPAVSAEEEEETLRGAPGLRGARAAAPPSDNRRFLRGLRLRCVALSPLWRRWRDWAGSATPRPTEEKERPGESGNWETEESGLQLGV